MLESTTYPGTTNAHFIQLASEINTGMPAYWAVRTADVLNEAGRAVKGSRVLVLGVTYKPGFEMAS